MPTVLLSVVASLAAAVTSWAGLAAVYRCQARRYNARIAADLLDDWAMQLELLDPVQRRIARSAPPANILAARSLLSSSGRGSLREGWSGRPARLP